MRPPSTTHIRVILFATIGLMIWAPAGRMAFAVPLTCPPDIVSSFAFAPAVQSAPLGANLIRNGDFEVQILAPGCHFNFPNAFVTNTLTNVTAYGPANEIDVMNDGTSCSYGGPPQSGRTKLALVGRGPGQPPGGGSDEFSFDLTTSVIAGNEYAIAFYAWSDPTLPDIGAIEIGLSTSPTAFGTSVFTGVPTTSGWTLLTHTFLAPINASSVTVKVAYPAAAWIHVDNFSLMVAGTTAVARRTWGRLKSLYRE